MAEPLAVGEPMRHRRLELLDVVRFLAALMVVAFHWFFNGINNGKVSGIDFTPVAPFAIYGYLGVYLFFMVSGFVIAQSVRGKTAGQFIVSRGVRLYPAYWAAMILTTVVVTLWGNARLAVTPVQFLANLTMAPGLFGQHPIDGVYWTLAFELMFYALVLFMVLIGLGRHLATIFPIWALVLLVAVAVPALRGLPYLTGEFTFFVSGAILATIQRDRFSTYQLMGLGAAGFSATAYAYRQVSGLNESWALQASPVIVVSIVASFFVVLALTWFPRAASLAIPFSRPISDLTYPIYLLHAHIGYTVLDGIATDQNVGWLYPLMFAGLFASAWALHWAVEVRLKSFWLRGFVPLRRPFDRIQSLITRRPVGASSRDAA